ncbi:MAG: hypothetical protein WEB88_01325 [Gemmatimonadota bacterium]
MNYLQAVAMIAVRRAAAPAALGALLLAACGPHPDDTDPRAEAPPPAAALVRMGETTSLEAALVSMEEELTALLADQLESPVGEQHLMRAEAISDRLLETEAPFHWISDRGYSVDAVLRQLQTLADRLVAQDQVARQFASGVRREDILMDARALLQRVRALRQDLTRGGTDAPPSLDQLLSQEEVLPSFMPAAPGVAAPSAGGGGGGGPVGTPVTGG